MDRGVLRRHTHSAYGGTEGPVLRLLPFWCPTEASPIQFCSGQLGNAPMLEGHQGEGTGSAKLKGLEVEDSGCRAWDGQ